MSKAIEVRGLRKTFSVRERAGGLKGAVRGLFRAPRRDVVAIDGVDFSIEPGERVAFVGPNGAGKSTTIKILSGILHPSEGEVGVLGLVPWQERQRLGFRIGTVFGQRTQLWYHLPPADTFDLLAAHLRARQRELPAAPRPVRGGVRTGPAFGEARASAVSGRTHAL